jgi:hypothetical protein
MRVTTTNGTITIRYTRKLGIDVYQVWIGGECESSWFSEARAVTRVQELTRDYETVA